MSVTDSHEVIIDMTSRFDAIIVAIENNKIEDFKLQIEKASPKKIRDHVQHIIIHIAKFGQARQEFQAVLDKSGLVECLYHSDFSIELYYRVNILDVSIVDKLCKEQNPNAKKPYHGKTPFFLAVQKWCDAADDAKKADENAKIADKNAKIADENAKKADENAKKAADENAKIADENAKKAAENAKKADENAKKAEEIVKILINPNINYKTNINYRVIINDENDGDRLNCTALSYAVIKQKWNIVKYLIDNGAVVENYEILEKIKNQNILISYDEVENNMLQFKTKIQLFEFLYLKKESEFIETFKKDENIDVNSEDGTYTFLQLACKNNLQDVVLCLLERNNVEINLFSGEPQHCLVLAAVHGSINVLNTLLSHETCNLNTTHILSGTIIQNIAYYWLKMQDKMNENSITGIKILIENAVKSGIDINNKSSVLGSALKISCISNNTDLFLILLQHGAFKSLDNECLSNIKPELLLSFFNSKIELLNIPKIYQKSICNKIIMLNYDFMVPYKNKHNNDNLSEMLPLYAISESKEHQFLLEHPIIVNFLQLKWLKLYQYYICNILFTLWFTICLSLYILVLDCNQIFNNNNNNNTLDDNTTTQLNIDKNITCTGWTYAINLLLIILPFICLFIREFIQFIFVGIEYFQNFANWLEVSIIVLTLLVLCNDILLFNINYIRSFSAILIILVYMMLVFIFGRHPSVLKYYTMFLMVSKKSIGILLCFLPIILAFSFGFNILFHNSTLENNPFYLITSSMRKTIIMITGEFDIAENIFTYNTIISGMTFIVFIILIVLILMNLINALAISDTQLVINKSERYCLISNVKAYTELETLFECYNYYPIVFKLIFNYIDKYRIDRLEKTRVFPLIINKIYDNKFFIMENNKLQDSFPNMVGYGIKKLFCYFVLRINFKNVYKKCLDIQDKKNE